MYIDGVINDLLFVSFHAKNSFSICMFSPRISVIVKKCAYALIFLYVMNSLPKREREREEPFNCSVVICSVITRSVVNCSVVTCSVVTCSVVTCSVVTCSVVTAVFARTIVTKSARKKWGWRNARSA